MNTLSTCYPIRIAVLIALMTSLAASQAFAFPRYCSEPQKPHCVMYADRFQSQHEFDMCKHDVERFVDDWKDYIDCVSDNASDEIDETIRKFNCMARGESVCF